MWALEIIDEKKILEEMKHKRMRLDEFIRLARSMVLKVSHKNRNFETKLSLTFM